MIVIIARLKVKDGKEEAAFEAAQSMVSSVQAEEPRVLAYICHRLSQGDAGTEMVFYETYADGAALDAHGKTPHMAEFRAKAGELLDVSQIKIERLERVAGFTRGGAT